MVDAKKRNLLLAALAAAAMLLVAGVAYANDSSGKQATGPGIEKAKSVALDHTNGGRVGGTEVGDEEGYYEVEVVRDDGSQVDVHLDRDYNVLGAPSDREGPDDEDAPSDD